MINLSGLAGSSNTTGDEQKKLDVIGNDVFIAAMRSSRRVKLLVSEEEEEVIVFNENPDAHYAVACDPIDGSSNLDAGVSVGTIFGIYRLDNDAKGTKEDLLRPGTDLVAAGVYYVWCLGSIGFDDEGWSSQWLHYGHWTRRVHSHAPEYRDAEEERDLQLQRGQQQVLA